MSLRKLPEVRADFQLGKLQFDMRSDVLDRWQPDVRAAADAGGTISIYDTIGETWDGNGVTAKRISAALRAIGSQDVTVNINSPGGNFFEGVTIFNLLREHPAKVTVQVMGLAASAASVIAMAGDEILMGTGSSLMIHNGWAVAIGNRHDMADAAKRMEPFDAAMATLYAERSGMSVAETAAMMDQETFIGASDAISRGFADGMLDNAKVTRVAASTGERKALALVDAAMAKAGHSRSARRDTLNALFSGTPRAAGQPAMSSAGDENAALLHTLISNLRG